MNHIDKMITEANLRDVKVFDFEQMLNSIETDIDNFRKLTKRHGIEDTKGLAVLLHKEEQLRNLAKEWTEQVGLSFYKGVKIVVLIEEVKT